MIRLYDVVFPHPIKMISDQQLTCCILGCSITCHDNTMHTHAPFVYVEPRINFLLVAHELGCDENKVTQ